MQKNILITLAVLCILANCQQTYDEVLSKKIAGFAFQSYCTNANIPLNNCGAPCQQNPQGLQSFIDIYNQTTNARAIAGYSPDNNAIIFSFRGSQDINNWMHNLDAVKANYAGCSSCQVHKGFLSHYESLKQSIATSFQILRLQYPNAKIYVTGHSLGAAAATLALPQIYQLNGNKKVDAFYNFSSPRVGNSAFSNWIKDQNFAVQFNRITHGQDPVISLPTNIILLPRYKHTYNEVFYDNFKQANYTYVLCTDPEDKKCAEQYTFSLDFTDHNYIFWNTSVELQACKQ